MIERSTHTRITLNPASKTRVAKFVEECDAMLKKSAKQPKAQQTVVGRALVASMQAFCYLNLPVRVVVAQA